MLVGGILHPEMECKHLGETVDWLSHGQSAKGTFFFLDTGRLRLSRLALDAAINRLFGLVDVEDMTHPVDVGKWYRSGPSEWLTPEAEPTIQVEPELERSFRDLVEQWHEETGFKSSVRDKVIHPAYQRIIGMGKDALPLILRELQQRPGHWFWALQAITGENPVPAGAAFEQAARAWIAWGMRHGFIE